MPRKRKYSTNAARQKAYRKRKRGNVTVPPRSEGVLSALPAPGTGTAEDWEKYLKSIGLGMEKGKKMTWSDDTLLYTGGNDSFNIERVLDIEGRLDIPAQPTRPSGHGPDSYENRDPNEN